MAGKRQTHTAAFKAQGALAALKGDRTVNARAGHFGVHPTLIHSWKKQRLAGTEEMFAHGGKPAAVDAEVVQAQLYEQIGRLRIEPEWLKQNFAGKLTRYHERRASGRKQASPGLVVQGSVRVAVSMAPRLRPEEGLKLRTGYVDAGRRLRAQLDKRRETRRKQRRFRCDPATYLSQLEKRCVQLSTNRQFLELIERSRARVRA